MSEQTLENLDLNLMLALYWLLSERNVTEAAHKLSLSQPATSRALGRLREVFDDPLLIKSGRTMMPTRKAELLQPAVTRAVERMRDVMRVSDVFNPEKQSGTVRIACKDHWGNILSTAWTKAVSPLAPKLALDLVDLDYNVVSDMTTGQVDLTIIPEVKFIKLPPTIDIDQFVIRTLRRDRYISCIRHGHPLSNAKISLEEYTQQDHILVNPQGDPTGIVDKVLSEHHLERHIAYRTPSFYMALSIASQTDAILTAPSSLFAASHKGLFLFEPPLNIPDFDINIAWHPNWTNNQRHKWVRNLLFEEIQRSTSNLKDTLERTVAP